MKLAAYIGTAQRDWEDLRSFALEAERIGLDSLWSAEAVGHDAFTPLAFIAAQTSQIGLGTGVVTLGARSAAMTAMSAVSLAGMSDGRFRLGIGANGPQLLQAWHARPFHPASKHLIETIEVIRLVSAGKPVSYEGSIYNLPGADLPPLELEPGIARPFPIYIAALSPRSLEATGLVADGWVGGASFTPSLAPYFRGHLERGAAKAGRDFAAFDFMAPAFLVADRERALSIVKPFLATQLGRQGAFQYGFHHDVYVRAGMGDLVAKVEARFAEGSPEEAVASLPDDFALERCFVGSDDDIRATLRRYRDCGVTTICTYWFGSKLARSLDGFARVKSFVVEMNGE